MDTLHGFSQSGNTYKVALMLQLLGVPWRAEHVAFTDFAAGLTRDDGWREQHNTMGEVPILETATGRRLTQSAAILLFLAKRHGRYGGETEDDQHEVLRWLFFDNHKFTSYFATWRFMKSFAATAPDPTIAQWLQGRIANAFGIVEKQLARQPYIAGSAPTIADLSLCGYLVYPVEESGMDIEARYPAMAAWLERLKALPGWKGPYELLPGERVPPRW
jgi:glutathione S-transferase